MKDQHHSISIVVADDHPVVLHGVADVLRFNSDMNVFAVCSDGATALEAIRKWSPNVAVLDIAMPGLTGLDVLATIAADGLATKVVLLAATVSDEQIARAVAGGVRGIVLKEEALTELVQCIRAVAEGRQWLPSARVNAALTLRRARSARQLDRISRSRLLPHLAMLVCDFFTSSSQTVPTLVATVWRLGPAI